MLHTLAFAAAACLSLQPLDDEARPEPPTAIFKGAFSAPVTFAAADGLEITANLYRASAWIAVNEPLADRKRAVALAQVRRSTPFIVLCHQAGSSRGEYREIVPRLHGLGFDCLAIDQRSGAEIAGVANETARRAEAAGQRPTYADAEQDILAALRFARENFAAGPLLVLGSSYSAALALRIAGEHPKIVDGVLAFAPGEYFVRLDQPANWIATSAAKIEVPCFISSAKAEHERWRAIFAAIPGDSKTFFLPKTDGEHGARALWRDSDASADYWRATEAFLERFRDVGESTETAPMVGG